MSLEVTLRDTLDATYIKGDFATFINDLNVAAAAGKQYVIATETRDNSENLVAMETRNITRIRELDADHAFIGR